MAEEETEGYFENSTFFHVNCKMLQYVTHLSCMHLPVAYRSVLVMTNNNISMSAHLQIEERVHEMFKVVLGLHVTEISRRL